MSQSSSLTNQFFANIGIKYDAPWHTCINTLRPRQKGRHFTDDVFKCIFLNENVRILLKISQKFVPEGPINNIPSLVQVMAWRRPGDKQLSEQMMLSLLTHICVARPQWVLMNCGYDDANMSLLCASWSGVCVIIGNAVLFPMSCFTNLHDIGINMGFDKGTVTTVTPLYWYCAIKIILLMFIINLFSIPVFLFLYFLSSLRGDRMDSVMTEMPSMTNIPVSLTRSWLIKWSIRPDY